MLDLKARVHFEEVEIALAVDDELDRTGAVVLHGACKSDGLLAHRLASLGRKERRWRLLEDFLVAALDRAFAFVEVDDVAMFVAEHLDLDVVRLVDELLDEDAIIAKRRDRFGASAVETLFRFGSVERDAQPLAAAAGRRLDHHRVADRLSDLHGLLRVVDQAHMTGHGAHAGFGRELLGGDLVAHRLDGVGVGADEDDLLVLQALGEAGILRQEAEARMDGFSAGLADGVHDLVLHEIALGSWRAADVDRLVGHLDRHRTRVRVGIDDDRLHAHTSGGLDHPAGDFPAICDQDFREHPLPRQP